MNHASAPPWLLHYVDRLGTAALELIDDVANVVRLASRLIMIGIHSPWYRKPAVMHVVLRQTYFTGVQGLPWVLFLALSIGALAVYNIVVFARDLLNIPMIGTLIARVLVLEIAPMTIALLLLSRSGVAIVTELGTMFVRGEDLTLKSMGISVHEYLLWPRLLAYSGCGLVLTATFVFVAIGAGGLFAAWSNEMTLFDFMLEIGRGTNLIEIQLLLVKGVLYPFASILILMDQGVRVGRDPNLIPIHATRAILSSLVTILLLDGLIALLMVL